MSAFIVSKEHINYLIQAAISRRILGGSDTEHALPGYDEAQAEEL
jgi:hypothetical protein